ncbi:unnamed protein product, partial [marine sediment metagenome]
HHIVKENPLAKEKIRFVKAPASDGFKWAVHEGHVDVAKWFMENRPLMGGISSSIPGAFFDAACEGHLPLVKMFLSWTALWVWGSGLRGALKGGHAHIYAYIRREIDQR